MVPPSPSYGFFFLLLLLLSLLSASSFLNPVSAKTDSQDVSALNVLFTSLNRPSQLMGWSSSGGDPCGGFWKGIKCSSSSVTEIKMSGLGLSGSLGYQLSSLTSVTHFDLSKNNLQGDIPYQLPPNAVHINLAGNALNGGIPYSVSQMTDIEYLNLASNQLNGQLTDIFGKLPKLSQLDLSFNQFSGNLPQSIGSLKSLKTLYLQNNQLTGSINVLANLPLDDLNVQNNQFTGSVPDRLRKIDNLQIDGNSLSGASSRTGGKKRMSGVVIVLIVIAALLVLVLLLAFIKRRKSSFQSPYIYEQSVKTRSFTPLVDNDLKDKSISASSSIDLKGLHTDPSLDLKPLSPLPSSRQGTLKGNEFSSRQGSLRENEFSSGQGSLKENKFAVRSNSKHRTNTAHARAYSLRDLQAATGSFSSSRLVGNGSIGCVYKAKYADGKVLAVKKVDSDLDGDFMDVISSISRLHHPNISELIGFCSESGLQLLVYGYERNGSLHDFLHLSDEYSNPLTWDTRVRIALGTARAIEYLHEVSVPSSVHKNIKSANILLDAELNPHLSDCGLTAYYKDTHNNNLGPGCNAPECTKPSAYTLKSDVYSFGVVMLELLTGRKPYDSSKPRAEQSLACWAASQLHDREALANIADPALRGLYPPKSLSRFADIIALCIQVNPEMRPAMSEVVQTLGNCVQRTSINKRVGLGLSGEMSASQRSDDSNYGYY